MLNAKQTAFAASISAACFAIGEVELGFLEAKPAKQNAQLRPNESSDDALEGWFQSGGGRSFPRWMGVCGSAGA